MEYLNNQMKKWASRLRDDLRLTPSQSNMIASSIFDEIKNLSLPVKKEIENSTPIPIKARLDELLAFQRWMDFADSMKIRKPEVIRAQVITQNYICFVYLKETWFEILLKYLSQDTATYKSCSFLLSEPIKFLRHGISHGNWKYKDDFSGLEYWNRKDRSSPYVYRQINQQELDFWQSLSRTTAYSSFLAITNHT